jgi:hypothetical protein
MKTSPYLFFSSLLSYSSTYSKTIFIIPSKQAKIPTYSLLLLFNFTVTSLPRDYLIKSAALRLDIGTFKSF